ncbi:hypothetical protein Poli38472_013638 [Pythium oligandrum]|uniref:FYVE-type domain-containing protein n=1 Tax=Pythium oligandrum TaxID=41045 RepID=A0A8K1CE82_PYTOL|nr:hypothetical protein Poli38472_013638 [Pythium oligandrum]|eukprot:TMW61175.1 hypothetical protein Poli38472_013638 [Pythium oligandrum]
MRKASTISRASESEGLVVHDHATGKKTLVMPSQDIADDVLATLPKLQTAVEQATTKMGRRWKQHRPKNFVELYEMVPEGGKDGGDDPDMAHALLAKAELQCHVNEVLSVLIHQNADQMDSTMQSLGGSKVRGGGIYFQQLRPLRSGLLRSSSGRRESKAPPQPQPQSALFSVQTMEVRSKFSMTRQSKHRLGFSTCTIRFPTRDRAYHLMKTLPKQVHDKVVAGSESAALQGKLDHLAIGWDVQLKNGGAYGSGNQKTQVIAHAYASGVPPADFGRFSTASFNSSALAQHRKAHVNSDAEHVIEVLTKSLREFETVIRRRRLGFQTFVAQPKEDTPTCTICSKKFSFFRRDHFCRLCGHVICGECSAMYDVEAPVGRVRKNRCCVTCIYRVDLCQFDDEDLVPALGPVIVDTAEDQWESSVVSLSDSLLSDDPHETSKALESLDQLINLDSLRSTASTANTSSYNQSSSSGFSKSTGSTKQKIAHGLDQRLAKHFKVAKDSYHADECKVYASERNYALEYDSTGNTTSHPDIPLAPVPDPEKEARRLKTMQASGVLNEDYDRTALNLLAQVAAKRLNCPIGVISMIDDKHFHPIGNYQLAPSKNKILRDENFCMHTIYAERPMILKNPQRDMRFAQMPVVRDGGIKFYAGFPVRAPDGSVVASLCTLDVEPHNNIETKDYATMEVLSELAAELIAPKKQLVK